MTGSSESTGPAGDGRSLPRRGLHGRRHGRRLRSGLKQLLLEVLPKVRVELPAAGGRLDLAALFPNPPAEIWLEFGFGGGRTGCSSAVWSIIGLG